MEAKTPTDTSTDSESRPEALGSTNRRYYRRELDVLRFFAFFMVFLSHVVPGDRALYAQIHVPKRVAYLIGAASADGAFGVDLFFALSSFLITTLLLRERQVRGVIDVSAFYAGGSCESGHCISHF